MTKGERLSSALGAIVLVFLIVLFVLPEKELKTNVIRITIPSRIIASLPHWVAEDKNLYKDMGLIVKTISYNNSKHMIDTLYSGDSDFLPAVSLVDVVQASHFKGADKVVIISHSRMVPYPAFENILVLVGSDISSYTGLYGKRIGVYPGVTSEATVKYFLTQNGVDVSSISFIKLPPQNHLNALLRGDIDASHSYDPFRTLFIVNKNARVIGSSLYGSLNNPSAIGVTVISSDFFKSNPESAEKLIVVWDKAIDFIRNNNKEARQIMANHLGINFRVAEEATWVNATKSNELSIKTIIETLHTMQDVGVIDSKASLHDQEFYGGAKKK